MNTLEFSVGNAMGHFRKTGGPKGFLWKYALAYALIGIVVQGLSLYLMAPIYGAAFNPIVMEDPDMMDQVMLESLVITMPRLRIARVAPHLRQVTIRI